MNADNDPVDSMEGRDIRKDLQPDAFDGSLTVSKSLLGLLPLIGPTLVELLSAALNAPLSRRKDEWMIYLAEEIRALKSRVPAIDTPEYWQKKTNDPAFFTLFLEASLVAVRTHREEKRRALRNGIFNSALGIDVEDEMRLRFVRLIDQFGPTHLNVLSFAVSRREWLGRNNFSVPVNSFHNDPQEEFGKVLKVSSLYSLVVDELIAQGLIEEDPYHTFRGDPQEWAFDRDYTTKLGALFYQFIRDPAIESA